MPDSEAILYKGMTHFLSVQVDHSPTRIEIPRYRPDLIAEHKQNCDKCLQTEQERKEQHERDLDTEMRMQGCQMLIDKAKLEVSCYQDRKKAAEDKKARGETLDPLELERLRISEYDAGVALETIRRETIELDRLTGKKEKTE